MLTLFRLVLSPKLRFKSLGLCGQRIKEMNLTTKSVLCSKIVGYNTGALLFDISNSKKLIFFFSLSFLCCLSFFFFPIIFFVTCWLFHFARLWPFLRLFSFFRSRRLENLNGLFPSFLFCEKKELGYVNNLLELNGKERIKVTRYWDGRKEKELYIFMATRKERDR